MLSLFLGQFNLLIADGWVIKYPFIMDKRGVWAVC